MITKVESSYLSKEVIVGREVNIADELLDPKPPGEHLGAGAVVGGGMV